MLASFTSGQVCITSQTESKIQMNSIYYGYALVATAIKPIHIALTRAAINSHLITIIMHLRD